MSKRKRPRSESPDASDVEDDSTTELTAHQIVNGLTHFWAPGSLLCFNDTLDILRSLRAKPNHRIAKEPKTEYPSTWHRYKDLIDFCEFEEKYNLLGSIKTDYQIGNAVSDRQSLNKGMSRLQHRYLQFLRQSSPTGLQSFPANLKRYFLLVSMAEHELEKGSMDDNYELSVVGDSCWTAAEKRRFFDAVERCSRGDVVEISRRVGPTKTIAQVAAYLNLLDEAAKGLGEGTRNVWDDERYSAREMSTLFMVQEARMSTMLNEVLETESFAKHQQLLSGDHTKVKKALDMFEVWNMSSLTRLFAGTNDITLLCSTLVQYHELLEKFVKEMLSLVYTELLSSGHTIVDRTVMNHVIAKRQKTLQDPDVRLKNLDIMAMLDKRKYYHQLFSAHRSASFLAKRRRKGWRREDADEQVIHVSSDSEAENESDSSEHESDQDDMLKPFDYQDDLDGYYYEQDDQVEGEEQDNEEEHVSSGEEIDLNQDEIDLDEEDDDTSDDELVETRMKELDSKYEKELMQGLGFYTEKDILDLEKSNECKDIN